jgi:hypothetical protein
MINWIKKLSCLVWTHKYYFIEPLSDSSCKLGCKKCHQQFAMNNNVGAIVPWNPEFEEFYKALDEFVRIKLSEK